MTSAMTIKQLLRELQPLLREGETIRSYLQQGLQLEVHRRRYNASLAEFGLGPLDDGRLKGSKGIPEVRPVEPRRKVPID